MDENSAAVSGTQDIAAPAEAAGGTAAPIAEPGAEQRPAPAAPEAMPRAEAEPMADAGAEERFRLAGEQEKTRQERARLVAEEQLRQIGLLDAEIKGLDDLMAMPEYGSFYALVKKGVSLVEAYKLTRYDKLMKNAADAASRQTMRSLGSRQHMTAVAGQAGKGDYVSVPAEVAAEYRLAKPGITEAEIRRKYKKYQKYQRQ